MEKMTFYKGAALDADTFCAAAYFDAQETPDEPGTDTALLTYSISNGWTRVDISDHRVSDVASAKLSGETEGFALSERGAIFGFSNGTLCYDLTTIAPTPLRATASTASKLLVVGDHGTFITSEGATGFTPLTDAYEIGDLNHNATIEEEDAYFLNERYVLNAMLNQRGELAIVELTGASILSSDLTRRDLALPRSFVGLTVDHKGEDFIYCGHTPAPCVYRQDIQDHFIPLFVGAPNTHTFTDLTVFDDEIFLADTNLNAGGLFVLSPEPEADQAYEFNAVDLPETYGNQPVWQVTNSEGALWVLRSKDLLRLYDGVWSQYEMPR